MMKFSEYSIKARLVPAIVTIALPLIIFNYFFFDKEYSKFIDYILSIKFLSTISFSVVAIYYLSEFARMLGKGLFEASYYKNEMYMPTTNFLLFRDDTYSEEYKTKFQKKISSDFDLVLDNKEQEKVDETKSRRKIVEAMALIRKKLHKNTFLLQHNIEYGAMRNAIGGSVFGCAICLASVCFFHFATVNQLAVTINLILFCFYLLMILFSKFIMNFYGKSFA